MTGDDNAISVPTPAKQGQTRPEAPTAATDIVPGDTRDESIGSPRTRPAGGNVAARRSRFRENF